MNEEPEDPTGAGSEGAASFLRGLPRENCPYQPDSTEREQWLKGWDQAAAGEASAEPQG
jgi:ribosome modulation factor